MLVKIFSNEHEAWWAADYCGYTNNYLLAGVFDYEEAKQKYPYIHFDKTEEAEDYFVEVSTQSVKAAIEELDWQKSMITDQIISLQRALARAEAKNNE